MKNRNHFLEEVLLTGPGRTAGLVVLVALVMTSILATAAPAATISVGTYQVEPIIDGDARSARVFEVVATENGTEAKVFVYPLLHDSPPPPGPPGTPAPGMFGSLVPGTYEFRMRLRMPEMPTELRVSWVADPDAENDSNSVQKTVELSSVGPSRWFQVTGTVTVAGSGVWLGRPVIVLRSTTGSAHRRVTAWIDDLALEQILGPAGDGCDPHCFRHPLDFESDPIGQVPPRLHYLSVAGSDVSAAVADHLPWQRLPDWYESQRAHIHTRLRARGCVCKVDVSTAPDVCTLDLGPNTYPVDGETFLRAVDFMSALGAGVWTRHVKWGAESPWWPTAVPDAESTYWPPCVDSSGGPVDIAQQILDLAHCPSGSCLPSEEPATRQIAYYWMMADQAVRLNPPAPFAPDDWTALDENGLREPSTRGLYLSQNSPYGAEVVAGRLRELVQRGADGVYFDAQHNPPEGDWSSWSASDFVAAGLGPWPPAPAQSLDDPAYLRLLDLYNLTLRDAFRRYHRTIHGEDPEAIVFVSAGTLLSLWEPQPLTSFAEDQQAIKGEWQTTWKRMRWLFDEERGIPEAEHPAHLPDRDVLSAFAFSLLRDVVQGRPPHVWVFQPAYDPCSANPRFSCDDATIKPEELLSNWQVKVATGALVSYGSVANLDVAEPRIRKVVEDVPPLDHDLDETGGPYLDAVAFGDQAGAALAGVRPHRWIGVHFNEHARQAIYADPGLTETQKYERAWNEVLAPAVWAFAALQQHGVPAGIVTDEQLARGDLYGFAAGDDNAYDVLFLPTNDLRGDVEDGVTAFEAAGAGLRVIRSAEGNGGLPWIWHAPPAAGGGWDTGPRDTAIEQFLGLLGQNAARCQDPSLLDCRVLDAPIEVFFAKDAAGKDVSPHIAAFTDPAGSGELLIAIQNRWNWMLNRLDAAGACTSSDPADCLSPTERSDYVPEPVGVFLPPPGSGLSPASAKIYLRQDLVTTGHTFEYAVFGAADTSQPEDFTWKPLPWLDGTPGHDYVVPFTTAGGELVAIISLDGRSAEVADDITFRSTLLIRAVPPAP